MSPAAWIPCPDCDEFWCTIHRQHAFECPCPPIEQWTVDPYTRGGPGVDAAAQRGIKPSRPTSRTRVSRPGGRSAKL